MNGQDLFHHEFDNWDRAKDLYSVIVEEYAKKGLKSDTIIENARAVTSDFLELFQTLEVGGSAKYDSVKVEHGH